MSKKTINSILLISVVLIYGYVLYAKVLSSPVEGEGEITHTETGPSKKIIKKDSFILKANYRDPFLGKTASIKSRPKAKTSSTNPKKVNRIVKPVVTVNWPQVRYYGLIKNTSKSNSGTGLLSVDGVSHKIKRKAEVKNLKILTLNKDSVIVQFNREKRVFYSKRKK